MKKITSLLTSLIFMMLVVNMKAQTVDSNYVDGYIYLKLRDTCKLQLAPYGYGNIGLNALFTKYGVNVPDIRKCFPDTAVSKSLPYIYHLHCSDSTHIDSLVNQLKQMSFIEYAEKEPLMKFFYTPNDLNVQQWHLTKINAFNAWDVSKGSGNVVIAIIDNGVRLTHQDIQANLWTNAGEVAGDLIDDDLNGYTDDIHGWDVADNDNDPSPPAGTKDTSAFVHGTHCAGIASAATDNYLGIASLGFNAKIMAIKCAPNSSNGSSIRNVVDGIYYAIKNHANIISMSWGGTETSLTQQNILDAAYSQGIVLIAAAGNDNTNKIYYPAASNHVIAVGASDANDKKASYSNYGTWVDVMAPGNGIYSTLAGSDQSYGFLSGTSMATPLVAGLASLVKAANPAYNPDQVLAAIKTGCDNIDGLNGNFTGQLGAGRINAYHTLVPGAISVSAINIPGQVSIYPVPASDQLTLHFLNDPLENHDIELLNILGEKQNIRIMNKDRFNAELNVAALPPGIFVLRVSLGQEFYIARFMKL